MKKFLFLTIAAAILGLTTTLAQTGDVTVLKINHSTIYKVEPSAIWTTTLNMAQVITRFRVTPATEILLNNRPAKLAELKPGFKVTIYYYDNPKCANIIGCNVAVRIFAFSVTPVAL
jgi:hypothetical protein